MTTSIPLSVNNINIDYQKIQEFQVDNQPLRAKKKKRYENKHGFLNTRVNSKGQVTCIAISSDQ